MKLTTNCSLQYKIDFDNFVISSAASKIDQQKLKLQWEMGYFVNGRLFCII